MLRRSMSGRVDCEVLIDYRVKAHLLVISRQIRGQRPLEPSSSFGHHPRSSTLETRPWITITLEQVSEHPQCQRTFLLLHYRHLSSRPIKSVPYMLKGTPRRLEQSKENVIS